MYMLQENTAQEWKRAGEKGPLTKLKLRTYTTKNMHSSSIHPALLYIQYLRMSMRRMALETTMQNAYMSFVCWNSA